MVVLTQQLDHIFPKSLGGKITIPCCHVCNQIKAAKVFDSLPQIQDYLLDQLQAHHVITPQWTQRIKGRRFWWSSIVIDQKLEAAVLRTSPEGGCTYCSLPFDVDVRYGGRAKTRAETWDSVSVITLERRVTVPCCTLCLRIQGSRAKTSLIDIQDYILGRLRRHGVLSDEAVRQAKERVRTEAASITDADIAELQTQLPAFRVTKIKSADRVSRETLALERDAEAVRRAPFMTQNQKRKPSAPTPMTRLRFTRLSRGLSQEKLAEMAGIPQPYVSRVERRESIHPDFMATLAQVLGLDPNELMEDVEK